MDTHNVGVAPFVLYMFVYVCIAIKCKFTAHTAGCSFFTHHTAAMDELCTSNFAFSTPRNVFVGSVVSGFAPVLA